MSIKTSWNKLRTWLSGLNNSQTITSTKAWFTRNQPKVKAFFRRVRQKIAWASVWYRIKWLVSRMWKIFTFPFKLLGRLFPMHVILKWGFISLMALIAGSVILGYFGFFERFITDEPEMAVETKKTEEAKQAPKVEAPETPNDVVSVSVNGYLDYATIKNGTISVKKGDVVTFEVQRGVFRKSIILYEQKDKENAAITVLQEEFLKDFVKPSEVISFTVPGRPGKYWLGKRSPTAFKVMEDGEIEVSVDYPDTAFTFVTYVKKGDEFLPAPVEIKFSISNELPKTYSAPRQIARLNSIAGSLLPKIQIEKKNPELNLKELAEQSIRDFNSKNNNQGEQQ